MTVPEVAARWYLSARAVRDAITRHQLRATKIGGQWLIRPSDLEEFEVSQMNVRPTVKRTRPPRRRAS